MYSSYSALFTFGLTQLQLRILVGICPPSNSNAGAQTVQFCSNTEVSSNDIYIDSTAASTRVTNCTCSFKVSRQSQVVFKITNNQTNDCRTRILYGINIYTLIEMCGEFSTGIMSLTNQSITYNIVLTIEQINSKAYCLHLSDNQTKIDLTCYKDSHIDATETTSTEPDTTTATTAIISASAITTTDTQTTQTAVQRSSTAQTTVQRSSTTTTNTSAYTNPNQGVPIYILAPAAGGGVLVVIGIIILAIVCSRRKTEYDYDEPGPKTDSHTYINQSIVTDVDEDDEMRVNELYRSIDNEPQEDEFAGGYAEINSTDASNTRKSAASINKGEKIYSVPSNRPLTQVQGGDVYSMPVKKPKNRQEKINDTPVYAMPDKEKNKHNQETGPVYAIVDKKNKNENSKTDKNKTNSSKPAVKKRPPAIASKPAGVKGGGDRKRKGNVNSERLCSEIELNVSSNNSNQSKFIVSEKTGYAEVL